MVKGKCVNAMVQRGLAYDGIDPGALPDEMISL